MEIEWVDPSMISIGEGRRPLNEETVVRLMESIQADAVGLRTPITIRMVGDDEAVLVTGRHRLEAVLRLELAEIPAFIFEGDERDARLWELAENIHRAELTVLERSEQVAEWVRLTNEKRADQEAGITTRWKRPKSPSPMSIILAGEAKLRARAGMDDEDVGVDNKPEQVAQVYGEGEHSEEEEVLAQVAPKTSEGCVAYAEAFLGQVAPKMGRGRPEGGLRAAAREHGIEHRQARRAQKIAALPEEVKAAAIEAGISDNQSALLRVTNEPSADQQLAAIQREKDLAEARRRNRAEDDYIAGSEADQFAEWLLRNSELREVPTIIAWLECAKPREIIRAMRRRTA